MINIEKPTIFKIEKINKKLNVNDANISKKFKISKRRIPWSQQVSKIINKIKEDDAITLLVKQYGVRNWTTIVNEMNHRFGFKNRSGKQCRER